MRRGGDGEEDKERRLFSKFFVLFLFLKTWLKTLCKSKTGRQERRENSRHPLFSQEGMFKAHLLCFVQCDVVVCYFCFVFVFCVIATKLKVQLWTEGTTLLCSNEFIKSRRKFKILQKKKKKKRNETLRMYLLGTYILNYYLWRDEAKPRSA